MKKRIFLLTGMFFFLFTSCLSPKLTNVDYKERATEGSPENSVVFIGYFENNSLTAWSQSNSEYAPDYQKLDGPFVISAPVAPGSRYRMAYVSGSYQVGNTIYTWSETYSMQETGLDIKIPDEPGLYYFGYYSGSDSYRTNSFVPASTGLFQLASAATPEKRELTCLRQALQFYKGTEWEAVIKARMEELN